MDRRVKYTQMVLNDSLIHFLEDKEISRITVKEICMDADINRSTYYVYYQDPYDQLAKLKASLLEDLTRHAKGLKTREPGDHQRQVLESILEYVECRKQMFRILLRQNGDHQLQHDILTILGEIAFPGEAQPQEDDRIRHYRMLYAANGCFGLFYHWLMNDDGLSHSELARIMAEITGSMMG